jgi:hypothetical protein
MPSARTFALLATVALATLFAPRAARADSSPPTPIQCFGAIQHPIEVKVEALDPIRRGQIVRVRLTARSSRPLDRAEVRLANAGNATIVSPGRVSLGTLQRDTPRDVEFRVLVPTIGRRALLQFVISGDEEGHKLGRGATLNLLPDGPQRPLAVTQDADGTKLRVYPARRIDR